MIYTIGHSTRSINEFMDLLYEHEIELLVDIRTYPGSKFVPHFNQKEMIDWLDDISYVHEPLLGGRRSQYKISDLNTVAGLRHKAFRNYGTYMQTDEFSQGLAKLSALADKYNLAYMCSEAVWWKCHRRMVSDALILDGIKVSHIMDGGLQPHKLTECAKLSDGIVLYPGG